MVIATRVKGLGSHRVQGKSKKTVSPLRMGNGF